ALVPEAVIVSAVPVEINAEPVFVRGIPLFLLDILKCPEASSDMIKHAVQHHLYVMVMQLFADSLKIIVCSKAAVDLHKISCIIAVVVRFEDRVHDDRSDPELLEIFRPFTDLQDPVRLHSVVVHGRPAESDRIYLIKSFIVSPHILCPFCLDLFCTSAPRRAGRSGKPLRIAPMCNYCTTIRPEK